MSSGTARIDGSSASSVLRSCLRLARRGLAVSTIGGVGFQLGSIALPLLVQRALDEGIVPRDPPRIWFWAGCVVALAVVAVLSEMLMAWFYTLSANLAGNRLHVRLVARVLELDRHAVGRFGEGDLAMRGTRDIDAIRDWLAGIPSLVTGIGGFAAMVVAIGAMDPLLLAVVAVLVPSVIAVNRYYPRRFAPANADLSAAHGARADAVEDLLAGAVAIRGIGAERVLVDRHRPRSDEVTTHTLRVGRIGAGWAATGPLIPRALTGVGIGLGGVAVVGGQLSVGQIVAFASWMGMIAAWVGVITLRLNQLAAARTAAGRVSEVLSAGAAVTTPVEPVPLARVGPLIAREVGVAAAGHWHLRPMDMTASPGELIAVSGANGTGKSTLLRLLARIDDPTGGTVSYAGVDLRDAAVDEVRDRITLVPQRPTVVSGTLAENLRLGRPQITGAMIEAACRLAAIDTHIASLPDRYDTDVGERGSTLSGGQVQRLAIARGALRGARVLLLDDPTSAVDVHTEETILTGLRAWLDGAGPAELAAPDTVIIASHRPAVLAAADRVVKLADIGGTELDDPDLVWTGRG